jgi:predicted ester cyclase
VKLFPKFSEVPLPESLYSPGRNKIGFRFVLKAKNKVESKTEENKNVVVLFNKEFLEKGNTHILKEIVADNFTNHTISGNFPSDVAGLIQFAEILRKGFPDLKVVIHEQIAENDLVSSLKTVEGTHLGEIMGHKPTGKKVKMTVIDMVRVKDGKYVDHWAKNDIMQVVSQL